MASAFSELLGDSSTVFVMSHKFADYDSVGSAIGVCCIARAKNKKVNIVIDMENNLARNIIDIVSQLPEYHGVFISEQKAMLEADSRALLVVVDTNRPDKVQSESLLLSCTRVAVVDHHRRAATYIDNAVLNFHEPSASSTSELISEMIQYLVEKDDILRVEAEALLAGIVLDTKGFAINTGSTTFDTAAFLRRMGADTADVKRLLQSDFETATARYSLMHNALIYREGIALASSSDEYSRISIAQAADELLNIRGVHTSFTIAVNDEDVFVSGRSIGGVNVQLILEQLGGGGSQSTAGVQVRNSNVEQVLLDLQKAIDKYFSN
jgi:c-di-AMP phosphodiesterase-like protein